MDYEFGGEIFHWRGPAPFFFVRVPADESTRLTEQAAEASYGWGMIPVAVRIGVTHFETSLFPQDGAFLVPLKVRVRRAENLDEGQSVRVGLDVVPRGGRSLRSPPAAGGLGSGGTKRRRPGRDG